MVRWLPLVRIVAAGLLCTALAPATAQTYPTRPLRLVVPFGAGTATDLVARHVGLGLASELGQPVAVENRPGGGGMIGAEAVARSAPDGYTILMGTSASQATSVSLFKKVPFDPMADFAPIARISIFPAVLVVHQSIPASTVAELIAYAKARPGQLNYATSGPGSQNHLQAAMLAVTAGLQVTHVPFKDASQIFGAIGTPARIWDADRQPAALGRPGECTGTDTRTNMKPAPVADLRKQIRKNRPPAPR